MGKARWYRPSPVKVTRGTTERGLRYLYIHNTYIVNINKHTISKLSN